MAARRIRWFTTLRRWLATLVVLCVTAVAVALIWQYYVTAPWTRDGRVRVLVANVAGTWAVSFVFADSSLFSPEIRQAFSGVSAHAVEAAFGTTVLKGIFAGWLIALMVWLLPSAGQSRLLLILIITYTVAIAHFSHLIAGSVEAAYLVVTGQISLWHYLGHFFVPTFLGNTIGGTSLVALLNHAPVREELDGQKAG